LRPAAGAAIPGDSMALIAFDLDGVLYSSEPFLGEAYREAIANVNRRRPGSFDRVPSTREILDHVGWPVAKILERLFPRVDPEAVALLFDETLDVICERIHTRQGRLYEDVPDTLRELLGEGFRLALASNGRRPYVETVLETYEIAPLFEPRLSADELGGKNQVLRGYVERAGVCAAEVVMVGDRASDVEAAAVVGCGFVGCDYGHGYRHEIEAAGPVAGRFADVPGLIDDLLAPNRR